MTYAKRKQLARRKWYLANKKKAHSAVAKWAEINKNRMQQLRRAWHLKSSYGLDQLEAERILSKGCSICGTIATHIDHDHKTKKIRGGLCIRCNMGLGSFKDSIVFLKSAIKYLKRSSK